MRVVVIGLLALGLSAPPASAEQIVVTEAGAGPTGLPAPAANLGIVGALHRSSSGDLLILGEWRLFRMDASGTVRVLAGERVANCFNYPYGDNGLARYSCLYGGGKGVSSDAAGNIYIADTERHVVRRIDAVTGIISRHAGTYAASDSGDGGPASAAGLNRPHGIAFDAAGNMFIADRGNHRVRRVSAATGVITTVAGNGSKTAVGADPGEGVQATQATLNFPYGVAVDSAGNLYIGDTGNYRIRKVSAITGIITTVAGNGIPGYSGENVPGTEATLAGPAGLSIDAAGNLLIADSGDLRVLLPDEDGLNHHVRRLNLVTGIISTLAGTDSFAPDGADDDGGPATSAALYRPSHAIGDAAGNLYIADQLHRKVRKVTASTGIISTIAGNGSSTYAGDGYPARNASLAGPEGLAFDGDGNLFVADEDNNRVRRIDAVTGLITTAAGNGLHNSTGDGGPATAASLQSPSSMAFDAAGNLYIAEPYGNRIRKVASSTGVISTIAGTGSAGYGGDGGPATQAILNSPFALAVSSAGDVFIADSENNRVRKVSAATGVITTAAGTGWGYHQFDGPGGNPIDEINDGGSATAAAVTYPLDVAVDPAGNLLISDLAYRVRKVNTSGVIATVAGNGLSGTSGDGGPATSAAVSPYKLALDAAGNLYLIHRRSIRRVDAATGIITTVLGNETNNLVPDGTSAAVATLSYPNGLAVDDAGRVHYTEWFPGGRVRTTVASPGSSSVPDGRVAGEKPLAVSRAPNGDLTLSWGVPCLGSDLDYEVYEGTIGGFTSHAPRFCSTSGATGVTFTPAAGNTFYLVVPRNSVEEGSYGLRSDGSQRPAPADACLPQHVADSCP